MRVYTLLLTALLPLSSIANSAIGTVYQLQQGETLRDVANRFLGGAENLPELQHYNKISNPLLITAGSYVAIPGKERSQAMDEIERAHSAIAGAVAAEAGTYAAKKLAAAQEAFQHSQDARMQGAYTKALALAALAFRRGDIAREAADRNAQVQESGRVTAVFGYVSFSADGKKWERAKVGSEVPVHGFIRTKTEARAELALADGSVIQVREESEVQISNFQRDRRTGKRDSELRVLNGEILGTIKKKKNRESDIRVKSHNTALSIRGTQVLVGVNDQSDVTRVSLKNGRTQVSASDVGFEFDGNQGTRVDADEAPMDPVLLVAPPRMLLPATAEYSTADQAPYFRWEAVNNERLAHYLLEVANDEKFNDVITKRRTKTAFSAIGILKPGSYHWRVMSIDTDGLEGRAVNGVVTIEQDMNLAFSPVTEHLAEGDRWVLGSRNRIHLKAVGGKNSSVVVSEFKINDGRYRKILDTIRLRAEGVFMLTARGVDVDGQSGPEIQKQVEVDLSGPAVNAAVAGIAGDRFSGRSTSITLDARDAHGVLYVEYQLPGEPFMTYNGPIPVSLKKPVTVNFRAVDLLGNESPADSITVR
ncbi:MAG: ferric-dicitrate binding protein FerR (iron transport regulator) [Rhodothermales bacterium]|jgi:ferric-dicitrate binding protein FerR (iron transport regulator)